MKRATVHIYHHRGADRFQIYDHTTGYRQEEYIEHAADTIVEYAKLGYNLDYVDHYDWERCPIPNYTVNY